MYGAGAKGCQFSSSLYQILLPAQVPTLSSTGNFQHCTPNFLVAQSIRLILWSLTITHSFNPTLLASSFKMRFSSTIAILALGASLVSAMPKAQVLPIEEGADPLPEDGGIQDGVEEPPVGEDPILPGDGGDIVPLDEGADPVEGGPTGIPVEGGDNAGNENIIQDAIPAECEGGCPQGWVLGNYWHHGCSCWHHGWHPTIQINSQNDNSQNPQTDNSVNNAKWNSPDVNLTETDNSRKHSPDVANGVGNDNGKDNGNGNGANVTQINEQNVAVAVDASPSINIYNADGTINEAAVEESHHGHHEGDKEHHGDWWPKNGTYTEIVTVLTTYCPEPTTIHQNGKDYPVHTAGYVTITDCPCTVVHVSFIPHRIP
jgi:hypothetical protein